MLLSSRIIVAPCFARASAITSDSFVHEARAYSGAYGVSKIAVEGYAKILSEELSEAGKIRVNVLNNTCLFDI
jgi:NAD(P)-dependent dehydrogenase (short-subunit alcohol dehydrogenase family)